MAFREIMSKFFVNSPPESSGTDEYSDASSDISSACQAQVTLARAAQGKGWSQCPRCGGLADRIDGCDSVVCPYCSNPYHYTDNKNKSLKYDIPARPTYKPENLPFKVKVREFTGNRTVLGPCYPNDTLASLRKMLTAQRPVADAIMLVGSRALTTADNHRSLESLGITAHTPIYLVARMRGG